jgi:hypothetical protein
MIVYDVETTGLNPEKHSLTSIGAVNFDNPSDRFYMECRIWDGADVSPEALKVNGLTEAQLHDPTKVTEEEMLSSFLYWIADKPDVILAGQNVHFDRNMTNAALNRYSYHKGFQFSQRIFDQHTLVMYMLMTSNFPVPLYKFSSGLNSDVIMRYVGLPPEPKPHIAINGAVWEYEALYRLIYLKPSLPQFEQYPLPFVEEPV